MDTLVQTGVVLGVCLLGEAVSAVLPVPVPAGVTSMILLFAMLCTKLIKRDPINGMSSFLLRNMAVFFIPSCVGIMRYADVFLQNALPILLICSLTTPVVFFTSSLAVRLTMRLMRRKGGGGDV